MNNFLNAVRKVISEGLTSGRLTVGVPSVGTVTDNIVTESTAMGELRQWTYTVNGNGWGMRASLATPGEADFVCGSQVLNLNGFAELLGIESTKIDEWRGAGLNRFGFNGREFNPKNDRVGAMRIIIERCGIWKRLNISRDPAYPEWVLIQYENGVYKIVPVDTFHTLCTEINPDISKNQATKLWEEMRTHVMVEVGEEEKNPKLIAVANGILNLETLELSEFSPEHVFLQRVTTDWNPEAQSPEAEQFLASVSDPVARNGMLRMMAYTLFPDCRFHAGFFIVGPTGCGKSTWMDVMMQSLWGVDWMTDAGTVATVDPALDFDIEKSPFGLAKMLGRPVLFCDDAGAMRAKDMGRLKSVITGAPVQVNRKNQNELSTTITGKVITLSNYTPNFSDDSEAILSRVVIFAMDGPNYREQGSGAIDYSGLCRRSSEFRSVILRYIVEAWNELYALPAGTKKDAFPTGEAGEKMLQDFADRSNPDRVVARKMMAAGSIIGMEKSYFMTTFNTAYEAVHGVEAPTKNWATRKDAVNGTKLGRLELTWVEARPKVGDRRVRVNCWGIKVDGKLMEDATYYSALGHLGDMPADRSARMLAERTEVERLLREAGDKM